MESILNNETMYEMMMPVITKLGIDKFGMYNSAERRKKASDSLEPFYNELKKRMMESEIDDLRQLPREDLLKLGFIQWDIQDSHVDKQSVTTIYLIPVYMLELLKKNTTIYNIYGVRSVYENNPLSLASRVNDGVIPFGIKL